MADNYPKSTNIRSQKPQSKHQENAKERSVITTDLNDNQKRWLVVGICLHSVISPVLRTYVGHTFDNIYNILCKNYNYLKTKNRSDLKNALLHLLDVNDDFNLNYGSVEKDSIKNNKIQNAIDLSKLFLQPFMAKYTGFNETCDSSALLGLIMHVGNKNEKNGQKRYVNKVNNFVICN
ncbi:unnamed protein product [Mytilus edulis]|uniref:Uncharacterized protein n=1 Tax=Mytilus edulis TaxID=6550 RepID=A0A8S3QEG7_MYTED|nr:unnamed protein product [Mytilus edulis]